MRQLNERSISLISLLKDLILILLSVLKDSTLLLLEKYGYPLNGNFKIF